MGVPKIQGLERKSYLKSIGLDPEDLQVWQKKWKGLKCTSKQRGVEFCLSFEDYVLTAKDSGVNCPSMIGRGKDKYGMARFGDVGPYKIGNCRFINNLENIKERCLNGGTKRRSDKISKKFIALNPDGEVFIGTNLHRFTKEQGLATNSLSACARGVYKQYLGWKCIYICEY